MTFNEARNALEAMADGRCFLLFTAYTQFSGGREVISFQAERLREWHSRAGD